MISSVPGFRPLKGTAWRLIRKFRRSPDFFLGKIKGLIHVGAHHGEERDVYAAHGLNVLWVEAIPEVHENLKVLLAAYPKQQAVCNLVTDVEGGECKLNISSNDGCSSSIFDLAGHKKLYPEVSYTGSITLRSVTLATLVRKLRLDLKNYDALVMDTQGSELLVLKGATSILPAFRFIETEAADFESYAGSCRLSDIDDFLRQQGFSRVVKSRFAHKAGVGSYFNVVYANKRLRAL